MQATPLPVTIEAIAPRTLLANKYGGTQPIEVQDGVYQLVLAGATANSNAADPMDYVLGGDTVILVEDRNGDGSVAARALDVAPRPRGR
ncbi:MAG: hypothetical protein M3O34_07545 [Chloroflexota bacterium]|nr:hypothetical protein [Chloroflexota bacterium]